VTGKPRPTSFDHLLLTNVPPHTLAVSLTENIRLSVRAVFNDNSNDTELWKDPALLLRSYELGVLEPKLSIGAGGKFIAEEQIIFHLFTEKSLKRNRALPNF